MQSISRNQSKKNRKRISGSQNALHESYFMFFFCKDKDLFNVNLSLNKRLPLNYRHLNLQYVTGKLLPVILLQKILTVKI